jgi:hypothetical protein
MNITFTIVEELGERKSYNLVVISGIKDDATAVLHQRIPRNRVMLVLIGLGVSNKLETFALALTDVDYKFIFFDVML